MESDLAQSKPARTLGCGHHQARADWTNVSLPLAMFSSRSPIVAATAALSRGVRSDALNRLQLDINAAHFAQQTLREPAAPVEKSPGAVRGEALRGDVQLPRELQDAVDKAILGKGLPYFLAPSTDQPFATQTKQTPTTTPLFASPPSPSIRISVKPLPFSPRPPPTVTDKPSQPLTTIRPLSPISPA